MKKTHLRHQRGEQTFSVDYPGALSALRRENRLPGREVCERLFLSPRTLQDYRDKGTIFHPKLQEKFSIACPKSIDCCEKTKPIGKLYSLP